MLQNSVEIPIRYTVVPALGHIRGRSWETQSRPGTRITIGSVDYILAKDRESETVQTLFDILKSSMKLCSMALSSLCVYNSLVTYLLEAYQLSRW